MDDFFKWPASLQQYFDSLPEDQRKHWSRPVKELLAEMPEEKQKELMKLLSVDEHVLCRRCPNLISKGLIRRLNSCSVIWKSNSDSPKNDTLSQCLNRLSVGLLCIGKVSVSGQSSVQLAVR
jgi:hypothetical protein